MKEVFIVFYNEWDYSHWELDEVFLRSDDAEEYLKAAQAEQPGIQFKMEWFKVRQ